MRAWPTAHRLGSRQALNREALPEVVLLGHANCGKSALLNALGAEPPRKSRLAVGHFQRGQLSAYCGQGMSLIHI